MRQPMEEEFPALEYREYQQEFLSDWYSPRKLFIGERGSGKTELLISETRRFSNYGFNCCVFSDGKMQCDTLKSRYSRRFGEKIPFDTFAYSRSDKAVGKYYDAILCDNSGRANDEVCRIIAPLIDQASFFRSFTTEREGRFAEPEYYDSVYYS